MRSKIQKQQNCTRREIYHNVKFSTIIWTLEQIKITLRSQIPNQTTVLFCFCKIKIWKQYLQRRISKQTEKPFSLPFPVRSPNQNKSNGHFYIMNIETPIKRIFNNTNFTEPDTHLDVMLKAKIFGKPKLIKKVKS